MSGVQDIIVTREQALAFLGDACRNWQHIAPLSNGDVEDVRGALTSFLKRSTPAPSDQAGWTPISEAPSGNEKDGPFFDVTWVGDTTRYGHQRRVIDCYREGGMVKVKHGYPAVWTIFFPQPTHFMFAPTTPTLTAGEGGGDEC